MKRRRKPKRTKLIVSRITERELNDLQKYVDRRQISISNFVRGLVTEVIYQD